MWFDIKKRYSLLERISKMVTLRPSYGSLGGEKDVSARAAPDGTESSMGRTLARGIPRYLQVAHYTVQTSSLLDLTH